jgi:hypothetical protein
MTPERVAAFERLGRLIVDNQVQLAVDMRRMNAPGSPVFNRGENIVPGFAAIALSLVTMATLGPGPGFVVLGGYFILWYLVLLPRMRLRVHDRTMALALSGPQNFQRLWEMGALQLVSGGATCTSPGGDWTRFPADRPTAMP